MQKILYIILSVAMLVGCSKEFPDEPTTPEQGEQVEVTFGASLTPESAESPASRAQVPFDQPQHGYIFVLDKNGKLVEGINPIELNIAIGGEITTNPEKVILTAGTHYTFRSVVASVDDPLIESTSVPIYSLLHKEGDYPDLLYATTTQTVAIGAQVQFAYNHIYGKVKFVLSKGEHITDDQLAAATLQVSGYYPEGAFNITTGEITTEPFETPVTVEKEAIYYAIPQAFTSGAEATAKVTTANGKTYIGKITKGDIKANKLTTITIKVNVEEPAAPVIGDFYMSDGTWLPGATELTAGQKAACIGIVFKVGRDLDAHWSDDCQYKLKDGTTEMNTIHGYVLALYDANGGKECQWGSYGTEVGTKTAAATGFDGYKNTNTIKEYATNNSKILQTDFPATYYATDGYEATHPSPDNTSGWFLPSAGQCQYWFNNKTVLLESVQKATGVAESNWADWYWSSSENNYNPAYYAWFLDFYSGYVSYVGKDGNFYVRSVLAF